ncbi:MAG: hypothetical protein KAV18_07755 [Candidatus Omnitrophica bacterium]|nr:hypothetical protein [Candidatus Omnitrophota bacterium]
MNQHKIRKFKGGVIGMWLGDACFAKAKEGKNVSVRITHSIKQAEYAKFKADYLSALTKVKVTEVKCGGYDCITVSTRIHPLYTQLKERSKQFAKFVKRLTDEGLAFWYMDDGSICFSKSYNKHHVYRISSRRISLHTEGFTLEENQILRDLIEDRFSVKFNVSKKGQYWKLSCGTEEAKKLFKIITPYIIPSMKYKLNLRYVDSCDVPLSNQSDEIVRPVWRHTELCRNAVAVA